MGRRAAGFTLIEILVAFAILAVALGALLQSFSGALGSIRIAESHAIAAMHARSKLAEVGYSIPLQPGTQSGVFPNDFRWAVTVQEFQHPEISMQPGARLVPFEIEVTVSWSEERQVSLQSVLLGTL